MQNAPHATIGDNSPPSDAEILQDRLRQKYASLVDNSLKLCESASRMPAVIENDEAAASAQDLIKMITGHTKSLEAERVNEKEPFLSQGRAVDGFFKFTIDKLEAAKRAAYSPLDTYLKKKEAEARRVREEEARKLREKAEADARAAVALQQANLKPAAEAMVDQAAITAAAATKAQAAAEVKPSELSQSRSASGSLASLRTVWVGELIDQGSVDLEKLRHHFNPDDVQKAINSFVKAGGRELAGVRIMESTQTVVR